MSAGRTFGFWDLVLYATAMNFGIRWFASGAAAGPASLPIWALAAIGFAVPLAVASAELAGRFSGEGAIYAWTRETFGPFWGFLCGWIYWVCNIPFFAGLIFFIANLAVGIAPPEWHPVVQQPFFITGFSVVVSLVIAGAHLAGLDVGKWLSNFGSVAAYALFAFILVAALVLVTRRGSATDFVHAHYAPPFTADGAILWATVVFAFGGAEAVPMLRNEVRGGVAAIVRALAMVAAFLCFAYIAGAAALLAVLPASEASRLSGLPDAIAFALNELGIGALRPVAIAALALTLLGGYSAWFGVAARLPYAAGLDHALPTAFAARDPKTGAPTVAIIAQTIVVIALVLLSQLSATTKAAYDFLFLMSALSYTLPYALLFAVYLKVQRAPAPAGAWVTPGGPGVARIVGYVALAVTWSAIFCTLVPSPDAPDKMGAVIKMVVASVVLNLSGVALYLARPRAKPAGAA